MNIPPFSSGDLIMGDREGVGLCTLWTPKDRYLQQKPYVHVIGNLYSYFGIGMLIRNVLATPSIHTIVITGKDNPEPTRHNASRLIHHNFDYKDMYIKSDDVNEFYNRTLICDAQSISLRNQSELTDYIILMSNMRHGHNPDPIIIPMPKVSREVYPTNRSGHLIRANSIKDAHYSLLKEIRLFGQYTSPDSEGHYRQELWQLTVCLDSHCTTNDIPLFSKDEVDRYGDHLWVGDEPGDLTYRYGHTMRFKYGDQIQCAIDAFKKKPETFRTIISLWEPLQSMLRDDEPCLITIHPRIRGEQLDMFAYIRTNEMFRAWPLNAAGLRYFQCRFAEELGIVVGELTITSGSAHVYDTDWPAIDDHLKTVHEPTIVFDSKGDWRFTTSGDKLIAEQYYDERLIQRIFAVTQGELEKKIRPFISSVSHALYIGRQIEKLGYE